MTRHLLFWIGLTAGCSTCSFLSSLPGGDDEEVAPAPPLFEHDGELHDGRGEGARLQRFDIDVHAGDRLAVTVSSRAFDPVLRVTLPGSDVALTNDDWEGSREHAQLALVVPVDGSMKVGVTSHDPEAAGRFRLLVRRPEEETAGGLPVVRVGDVHSGELDSTSPTTPDGRYFEPLLVQVGVPAAELVVEGQDGFAPAVTVTDPAGRVSSPDSRGAFPLATSGFHAVQVVAPAAAARGAFTLRVTQATTPVTSQLARNHHQLPGPELTPRSLETNRVLSGQLEASDGRLSTGESADVFRLDLAEGALVALELTSSVFDPYLMVVSPSGQHWENDDAGAGTGAALSFNPTEPGAYRVVVTSFRAGETGPYDLKAHVGAHSVNARVPPAAGPEPIRGTLANGDSRLDSGEFFDEHMQSFGEGAHVTLEAKSTDFDAYLIVVPPKGNQLDNDDGEGMGTDARITLTSVGGDYRILVTSYSPGETGAYELRVVAQGESSAPTPSSGTAPNVAALGPETRGSLAAGDSRLSSGEFADYYRLPLTAGASVQLRLASTEFDPYLIVRMPDGQQHDNDDLVPGSTDSGIDMPLAEAGEHTVIVTSYRPGETGSYRLRRLEGAGDPATC